MSKRWDITGVDNRILEQYRDSPNLLALLRALIDDPNNELRAAFEALLTRLDIDASEGIQLDLIGSIIGRPRPTVLDPLLVQGEGFFEFRDRLDPNEPDLGFDSLIGVGSDTFTFVGFDGLDDDIFALVGLDGVGNPEASNERKSLAGFLEVGLDVFEFVGFDDIDDDIFALGGLDENEEPEPYDERKSLTGFLDVGLDVFEFGGLDEFGEPEASSERNGFGEIGVDAGGLLRSVEGIAIPQDAARSPEPSGLMRATDSIVLPEGKLPAPSNERNAFGEIGVDAGGLLRAVEGIAIPEDAERSPEPSGLLRATDSIVLPDDKLPDPSDIRKGFNATTEQIGGLLRTTEGIVMPEPVPRNFEGAPFKGEEELPALPDPDYRELLKAAIFLNTSGASVPELEFYGRFVLGTTLTIVNGFTAINLEVSRRISVQERAIIDATLLPAAGIRKREVISASGEGAFSFEGNPNCTGFSGFADVGDDAFEFIGLDQNQEPEMSNPRKAFGEVGGIEGGLMSNTVGVVMPEDAVLIPNFITTQAGEQKIGAGFARVA